MALVTMQKVAVIGHRADRERLITALHEQGVLHIEEPAERSAVDHSEVEFKQADVQYAIDALKEVADKATLALADKPRTIESILQSVNETDVHGIVATLRSLEENDTTAERELQEALARHALLEPWRGSPYHLDESADTRTTCRFLGRVPDANIDALRQSLGDIKAELQVFGTLEGLAHAGATVWQNDMDRFEETATSLGWTTIDLPVLNGTPAQLADEAAKIETAQRQVLQQSAERRRELSQKLPHLLNVQKFMHWLDDKQRAREAMGLTQSTFTLEGWMPKREFSELENRLRKISPAVAVLPITPDENEDAPVMLKNNKWVAPFESVTSLYGLPRSSEGDPTAALSPFFILFFALCLTDAGYGLVLALLFGIYLLVTKKSIEEAKLPWLLFFSGIVTILVSIPFGGWFGLAPEQMPAWLTRETPEGLMFHGQIWHLGRESGIAFLQNLAVILGLTHLFFGMFLAGYHKWIHDRKAEAFWNDFTPHLLLGAVLLFVFAPETLGEIPRYTLYAAVALFVWGKGYGNTWFLRPVFGLLGAMNFAIGLLSNSLSYLRILALGLVTGAIAAAINQVALEMGRLFPVWIGIPVIVIIFVGGHLVSIALNTLGSFIHSGRLQFIEFFSQFFEGGGREFTPFKRSTT